MAPDVIDLISSSPPPPPAARNRYGNARHDAVTATRRVATTADATSHVLSDDFLFLSDDFDTTIDLDEPILTTSTGGKRKLSPVRGSTHVLSDDFDTTIDLDEPILATSTGGKRKLSPARGSSPPGKRTPLRELPGPSVRTNTARAPGAYESIDITSSPEPILSPEIPIPKARIAETRPASTTHPVLSIQSSDPFASSPRPTAQQTTTVPASSYPVASPPRPTLHRATVVPDSSDPFGSSPRPPDPAPVPASVPKPREARPIYIGETPAPVAKPTKRNATWDPISSSAPESRSFDSSPPPTRPVVIDIEDSGSDGSEEEFPDVADFDIARCRRSQLQRSQSDVLSSRSRTRTTAKPQRSASERAREKEARAAAKEVDKEKKRLDKLQAKEDKAREKDRMAALAEVNKLRTDKKVSTPEMMVDMPSSLNPTIKAQLETLLEGLDVQYTTWDSPVDNVIKWRRKVRSRYNDDLGIWEPLPLRIEDEKHVLVLLTADEFVKMALADDLEAHVGRMQRHLGGNQIIYLLEGLTPWMRKNRNLRNRQFTSHVRSQEPTTAPQRRRTAAAIPEYVPEEKIDDALLQLQVMHDVLIHHTTIPLETAQWIAVFTQHVSTVPYRKQRDRATLGAGFCMESGQVKTGEDTRDTYVRMLQEIVRVTAPIAYGIAAEFSSVSELVCKLEAEGPLLLEDIRKSANKDGAISDRTVGQAVSRRMHKVFTTQDELSTDV